MDRGAMGEQSNNMDRHTEETTPLDDVIAQPETLEEDNDGRTSLG